VTRWRRGGWWGGGWSGARGRRRGAFTLIEAVIALVVLGVAVPPMLVAVKDAAARRADLVLASRARWLAAERLEDILADRASATRGYAYVTPGHYPAEASVAGFPNFARSVSVVETGPNFAPGTGLKTVTVSVSWRDGRGRPRTLHLSSVVTEYTP
jgi:Tfp pilus assembly protein PilV